jgi:hypothetical protein
MCLTDMPILFQPFGKANFRQFLKKNLNHIYFSNKIFGHPISIVILGKEYEQGL